MPWLLAVFLAPWALAEDRGLFEVTGEPGRITAVEIITEGSDQFFLEKGSVTLQPEDGGAPQRYFWGGTRCGNGRDFTDSEEDRVLLLATTPYMIVQPYYKPVAQGARCLVRFSVSNAKYFLN
jgi:hypothetical protein